MKKPVLTPAFFVHESKKTMPDPRIGQLQPSDTSFRAACLYLASDSFYSNITLSTVNSIYLSVVELRTLVCEQNGKLTGLMTWDYISQETAERCIRTLQAPTYAERSKNKEAVIATAFVAETSRIAKLIWTRFEQLHSGKVVLYERRNQNSPKNSRLKWIDKSGKKMGMTL